jgi:hypothetical protein
VSSIGKRHKIQLKRAARRKQAGANRDQKFQEVVERKRKAGGGRGAPISIALIPISATCSANVLLQHFLQQFGGFATVLEVSGNATHIKYVPGSWIYKFNDNDAIERDC